MAGDWGQGWRKGARGGLYGARLASGLERVLLGSLAAFGSRVRSGTWAPLWLQRVQAAAAGPRLRLTLQTPSARAAATIRRFKGLLAGSRAWRSVRYSLHLQLGQPLLDLGLAGGVFRQKARQSHVQVLHRQFQLLDSTLDAVMNSLGV